MAKVLALDPIHEKGLSLLRARDDVTLVHLPTPDEDAIRREMRDADVLLLRARRIPQDVFAEAKAMRLVSRHGVGCDNLDLPWLEAHGVGVAVAADSNLFSVAEHAFALLLAGAKNLLRADQAVRANDFAKRGAMGARDIHGSTILVVGFGRVGRAFAARAVAFGAEVLAYDPVLPSEAAMPPGTSRATDLAEAVSRADAISLHVPLTDSTRNLFDGGLLAACRPGAIFVNTARGGIVDEAALVSALDRGRPGLYATDVFADEPPPADDPLFSRQDVILSPHSAAMTAEGVERMAIGCAQNALDYIDGTLPQRMVMVAPRPYPARP